MATIPINPEVLQWARETAGFSEEELVKIFPKYKSWEDGRKNPTYKQLERLAKKFKRPIALFFFPGPPEEEEFEKSLRILSAGNLEKISPTVRFLFRKGKSFQMSLYELLKDEISNQVEKVSWLKQDAEISIPTLGKKVRDFLGISIEEQLSWESSDQALKHWRNALAHKGIFVFKDAFYSDEVSGFCLYDEVFPIIYVNNSHTFNRQIFTIFHELGHLIFKESYLDIFDSTFWRLEATDPDHIEVKCNSFAGHFLVPDEEILKQFSHQKDVRQQIEELAVNFSVSSQVILRKLLNTSRINETFYQEWMEEWLENWPVEDEGPRESGGNYYNNQMAYLGDAFLSLVIQQYHQGKLSLDEASDYTNVKPKNFNKLEEVFLNKELANVRF